VSDWLPLNPDGVPVAHRQRPWVLCAAEPSLDGGKSRKIPRQIAYADRNASSTDPATWGTFDDAVDALSALTENPRSARLHIVGVGVVLVGDGLTCVDMDDAITPSGLSRDAARIVMNHPSFTEVSVSRTGLHLWVLGTLDRACIGEGIEAYDRARFIVVTGQRWPGTPPDVEPAPALIATLNRLFAPDPSPSTPTTTATRTGDARVQRKMPIREGTRDNSLFRIAAKLVADGVTSTTLLDALLEANARLCQPPLPRRDVERIARSASRRG